VDRDSRPVTPPVHGALPSRRRRLITAGIGLVVIGLTFAFVLPRIAGYAQVWHVVRTLSWLSILALAGATVLNVVTFAPPWMICLPGLGFRRALAVTQASTATTYVAPGGAAPGMAVSFAMLRGWGYTSRQVAVTVAVTGVWNQLIIFGSPPLALAMLALIGEHDPLLQSFALIGVVVFGVALGLFAAGMASAELAGWFGDVAARLASGVLRIVRRRPARFDGRSIVRFRSDALHLLRRKWHLITAGALAGQLSVFFVLYVTVRVLGIGSGALLGLEIFAAWSVARLLGSLPITPGGIGVIELGLTSLLVGFGGPKAKVVAAVLVYRFLTVVPTLLLGLIAAATWRRHRPSVGEERKESLRAAVE
jgi:putative heme transporter